MSGDRYQNLFFALRDLHARIPAADPLRILEIGTYDGARAIQLIEFTKKLGRKKVEYLGFDLFESMTQEKNDYELSKSKLPPTMLFVSHRLKQAGASFALYAGDTVETLPRELPKLPHPHLAFIDGGHSLETVASDWKAVSKRLTPGAICLLDDYYHHREGKGCRQLIERLRGDPKWSVKLLEPIDRYEHTGVVVQFAEVRPAL